MAKFDGKDYYEELKKESKRILENIKKEMRGEKEKEEKNAHK